MNIFKQLVLSLYSPKSIASWRYQGIGKTILFVFLLTLISILPTAIQVSSSIINGLQAAQETINEKVPSFTIENGKLTSDENSPITIEQNDFTIIFDPSGEIALKDIDSSGNTIALLKNEFAITSGGTVENVSYSMVNDLKLTKDDAIEFLNSLDSLLSVIISIFVILIYLFSSAMKFIGITVLALIGTMLKKSEAKPIQYRHLWRIAAYSITLPTIFFTIMDSVQTPVPYGVLLNWFVSILVLVLALKEIPQSE